MSSCLYKAGFYARPITLAAAPTSFIAPPEMFGEPGTSFRTQPANLPSRDHRYAANKKIHPMELPVLRTFGKCDVYWLAVTVQAAPTVFHLPFLPFILGCPEIRADFGGASKRRRLKLE